VNGFPRFVGPFLELPPADDIRLCEATTFCMGIAAWAFSIAGWAWPATISCFDCVDDLVHVARQRQLPIEIVRVQPDLCQACGRLVFGPRHTIDRVAVGDKLTHYAHQVGPFCGPLCGMRWTNNPRAREAQS
jgi:hypothetical protein